MFFPCIFLTKGFVCVFCKSFFLRVSLFFARFSFVLQWVFFCFLVLQSVFLQWFLFISASVVFLQGVLHFLRFFCKISFLLRGAFFLLQGFFFYVFFQEVLCLFLPVALCFFVFAMFFFVCVFLKVSMVSVT